MENVEDRKPLLKLSVANSRKSKRYWATPAHVDGDIYLNNVKIGTYTWNPEIHGKSPNLYEVESSLVLDASCVENGESFEDFCSGFGYDIWGVNRPEYYKQYNACVDTYWTLRKTGMYNELKTLHEND